MVDLTGVPLSEADVADLDNALTRLLSGEIDVGQYNDILIRIKSKNSKRPSKISGLLRSLTNPVRDWFGALFLPSRVGGAEYKRRLSICANCTHKRALLGERQWICAKCGCLLKLKARLQDAKCPDREFGSPNGRWHNKT